MKCSCLKNDFNLNIYTTECNILNIEDHSLWMTEEGFEIPSELDIEVIFPNQLSKSITINPHTKNTIDSLEFISESCFPDGVYLFKTNSCTEQYSTHRLISCGIESQLHSLKSQLKMDDPWDEWSFLIKIETLLKQAHLAAENKQFELSSNIIERIEDELQKYECCF